MNIVIVVYDGIDIWDLAFPYKAFSFLENVSVQIATNNKNGEILCKDKNLCLGSFVDLDEVEQADILWLCQGESSIDNLNKDQAFKNRILRLASAAKKIVCVGGSSLFLMNDFIEREKSISSHPSYAKKAKKAKLNYVSEMLLNNDNIISMPSRIGVIPAIKEIYREFFSEEELERLLDEFNLLHLDFIVDEIENKKRMKDLKKLYKQALKNQPDKNIMQLKVDDTERAFAFYVQDDFDFLSFAIIYSILSNDRNKTMYIVADKKDIFYVEGRDFYIKSSHALHQIQRVNTLVLSGGRVISERLKDRFLKHWISEIVPRTARVISLDDADRLLGVSGVLVDYDPILELSDEEKAKIDGKFVFLQNAFELMIYLDSNLHLLSDEKQADLLKSEYFYKA